MAKRKRAKTPDEVEKQVRRINSLGASLRFRNERESNKFTDQGWVRTKSREAERSREQQLLDRMNRARAIGTQWEDNMSRTPEAQRDAAEYTSYMRRNDPYKAAIVDERMSNRKYTGYQNAATTRAVGAGGQG